MPTRSKSHVRTRSATRSLERISVSATPVGEVHGPFDVVMANILPDVLVPLAGEIAARVGDGGTLVLSGILRELADGVEAAYVERGLDDDGAASTKTAGARS